MSKRKTIDAFFKKKMLAIQKLGHLWLQKQMLILRCLMNTPPNVQNFNLKRQIVIQEHVNKYVNFLSTNKMKFDEFISQKVHTNLKIQTIHTMMILIVVDFNLHGLIHIRTGWNTHLQWMRYIVYLATFLVRNQQVVPDQMHSFQHVLIIGKR